MLHAISQKKGTLYRRYLGCREKDEVNNKIKVNEEDEITALLLGPLALFPRKISALFWGELLKKLDAPNVPVGLPCEATMKFWPSRPNGKGGRIEPDLHISLTWDNREEYVILVELKWRAPLSGEDQLHKQWVEYLCQSEREKGWHIFIGKETSEALKALSREDVWRGRLLPVTWHELLGMFDDISGKSEFENLEPWFFQVAIVLDRLSIRRFRGFKYLCTMVSDNICFSDVQWKVRLWEASSCRPVNLQRHLPIFFK